MTSTVVFAYGTYLAALLCFVFCFREWWYGGWKHGLKQLVMLVFFGFAFWLLESWAGVRAPFYEYQPPNSFPHIIPRADFLPLAGFFSSMGLGSLAGLFGPGPAAYSNLCAILPYPDTIPLCIPVAGACIAFCLLWTVRLLVNSKGFAYEPFAPLLAPWIVGLMAFWLDLSLDPVLAHTLNCVSLPGETHPGLQFWTWHADGSLGDIWFHVPIYNYGVWYASPAILTAIAILAQWLYLKLTGASVSTNDGVFRALILFFVGVIFFVSPNSAASLQAIYALIIAVLIIGILWLINRWESFKRDNDWRWELIVVLGFYFLFPVFGLLVTEYFRPLGNHIWLLLITLVVAGWGVFFAISPYWKRSGVPVPISSVIGTLVVAMIVLGYLGNKT